MGSGAPDEFPVWPDFRRAGPAFRFQRFVRGREHAAGDDRERPQLDRSDQPKNVVPNGLELEPFCGREPAGEILSVAKDLKVESTCSRFAGAIEGTRTPTPLRVHGPEPCASANSATMAISDRDATVSSRRPSRKGLRVIFYRRSAGCQTADCYGKCHQAGRCCRQPPYPGP